MAPMISKSIISVVLLLLLAISQVQAGLLIGGVTVSVLGVTGTLWCSPNGNACPGCRPLGNVKVDLLSNGVVIASATTSPTDGSFKFTVTASSALNAITNLNTLVVRVNLPTDSCTALATTTGALQGVPVLAGSVVNGVASLVVTSFTLVH